MQVIFKSDDTEEVKRIVKSLDMALFIFDLLQLDSIKGNEEVERLLERYNISIDELIT
jgi:hypothetical protein